MSEDVVEALSATERVELASRFLLQAPPGEINDVLNDVRNLIQDDDLLQDHIKPTLREYNLEQFTTVEIPGAGHQSIISDDAIFKSDEKGEERFLDPRSRTTFVFDHLSLEASDLQQVELSEYDPFRAALETSASSYITAHFPEGVTCAFSKRECPNVFVLQTVSNKYNPTNFWSGRWRSEYQIDLNNNKVKGRILVNVHYFEQGNVQLSSTHDVSFVLPPAIISSLPSVAASKIVALIEEEENQYQMSLKDTYQQMGENTFKLLRRALPLTRQKIDWDKVLGYKLGAELASNKNVFGSS